MRPSITPDDPEGLFTMLNQLLSPSPQNDPQAEQASQDRRKTEFDDETIPTTTID
jgi:hypothetical protein